MWMNKTNNVFPFSRELHTVLFFGVANLADWTSHPQVGEGWSSECTITQSEFKIVLNSRSSSLKSSPTDSI